MSGNKTGLKSIRVMTAAAMLTALSVIIGIFCKNLFTFNVYYRVTFENLPIILSGLLFGPLAGAVCGVCADILSCICSTNPAVNPLITVGAACVGLCAGLVPRFILKKRSTAQYAAAVFSAHLLGQVIIKSIAKMIWFGMPWWGAFLGLGISAAVGSLELLIIKWLMEKVRVGDRFGGK